MPQARQNWISWLLLGVLSMSGRTVVSAQSDQVDSPSQRLTQVQTPQSGSLAGRLTNLHSAPLAGVSVVLRNRATGAESRTTTAKNGAFRFASLDAGEYTLEADAAQLGHGRLEEILVTGGIESRVQAAMNFEPAPPALLEASAPPPQIVEIPVAASAMATVPIVPPPTPPLAPSLASTPATATSNIPPAAPRTALVRSSPQLIASVPERQAPQKLVLDKPRLVHPDFDKPGLVWPDFDEPLSRVQLAEFAAPYAARPSTQPTSPTQLRLNPPLGPFSPRKLHLMFLSCPQLQLTPQFKPRLRPQQNPRSFPLQFQQPHPSLLNAHNQRFTSLFCRSAPTSKRNPLPCSLHS